LLKVGGSLKEVKSIGGDSNLEVLRKMPVHLWKGYICNISGDVISKENELITGTRNKFGKGEVIWVPSLLGLGARRTGDSENLSELLIKELNPSLPICLHKHEKGVFMQTSKGENSYISVIINKNNINKTVSIKSMLKPNIIFSNKGAILNSNILTINPEETVLITWK